MNMNISQFLLILLIVVLVINTLENIFKYFKEKMADFDENTFNSNNKENNLNNRNLTSNNSTSNNLTSNNLTNDENLLGSEIPVNDISYGNEYGLRVPTKNMVYNEYDVNKPANDLPTQKLDNEDLELEADNNNILVNTGGNTPLVYSLDEISETVYVKRAPETVKPMDAGSGIISTSVFNNDKLNNFNSIE